MTTRTQAKNAREVFEMWRLEDSELATRLDGIRETLVSEANLNVACCSTVAHDLTQLRAYLVGHFKAEDELSDQLAGFYADSMPEIEAMRRQSERDHERLLNQLDELIANFKQSGPNFDSWTAALDTVEQFVDWLEQHEDQEAESVSALLPHAG